MSASRELSALVLGAVTRDVEPGGATAPGGVVHYAGLAFAALGAHTRVGHARRDPRTPPSCWPSCAPPGSRCAPGRARETTTYANDYSGSEDLPRAARRPRTRSTPDDLPAAWRRADAIHLGPLHRRDLAARDARDAVGLRVGIDLQGLVRLSSPTRHAARAEPGAEGLPGARVGREGGEEELAVLLEGRTLRGVPARVRDRRAPGHARRARRAARDTHRCRRDRRGSAPSAASRSAPATSSSPPICMRARATASRARPARFAARTSAAQIERGSVPGELALGVPGV